VGRFENLDLNHTQGKPGELMKTPVTILASFIVALSAGAQGLVNFANTATSLIKYATGAPVPAGQFTAQLLYWATDPGRVNLDSSISALTSLKTTTTFLGPPNEGRFIGGTATTPNTTAGGANAWFAVVVWQTAYGSYDAARSGGGIYLYGDVFQNATGNPNSLPPGVPAALTGFTGIPPVPVPEPPALLLSILGGVALRLFRGREKIIDWSWI